MIIFVWFPVFSVAKEATKPYIFTDRTTFTKTGTTPQEDYESRGIRDVNKLDEGDDFVTWTHHFSLPPGEVVEATLMIYLKDDGDLPFEYAFIFSEDLGFYFDGLKEPFQYNVQLSSLRDGAFTVKVVSLKGDFYIVKSELKIQYRE